MAATAPAMPSTSSLQGPGTGALLDHRRIDPSAERYNATLVGRIDETDDLARFVVRFDGSIPDRDRRNSTGQVRSTPTLLRPVLADPLAARPGQYVTLGIEADGHLVQRPYSPAAIDDRRRTVEVYVRRVPLLRFTSLLWRLPIGHRIRITGPKGAFLLDEADDRTHLFVASGTGIAPFVAMMRDLRRRSGAPAPDGRRRRAVVLHGVSHVRQLGYRREFEAWQRESSDAAGMSLDYVPTISRPDDPSNAGWAGWAGRVESVIARAFTSLGLRPELTVAYLCGNPEMIELASASLAGLGLPPSEIRAEQYWPKDRPQERRSA